MASVLVRLAPILRRHHGVVTAGTASEVGVDARRLGDLMRAGVLRRVGRGVYVATTSPDSWERQALIAQHLAGHRSALSHWSAARILELAFTAGRTDTPIETVVPRDRFRPDAATHQSDVLAPDDIRRVGPFRVTAPPFTLGALGERMGAERLARAIDAAVADEIITLQQMRIMAIRMWHVPGVVCLREALVLVAPEVTLTRSQRERLFLRICRTFGLPLPIANHRVVDASGRVRFLDFAYVDQRVMIEIDVHPSHERTLGRHLDGARQNDLVVDWTPLRFDDHDLVSAPDQVAATVRRVLGDVAASPQ